MNDERLTKVYVDLPHHWATGGESMWAVELGGSLFELRNAPFHAYDLNFGDVVRAISDTWEGQGWIEYETCEARVPGSFDDRPGDDETSPSSA